MVIRNKLYNLLDKYKNHIKQKHEEVNTTSSSMTYRSKIKIIKFYLKHNRWPSRNSKNRYEKTLGTRFENFVSKQCSSYDTSLRRIAMVTGRTTNNKRKHNVKEFKKDIVEFLKIHNRVPSNCRNKNAQKGESTLRCKLDYYTKKNNDMTLLGKVYEYDKCHRTGIPAKYRALINTNIIVDKPLIRLVKDK